MSEEQKFIERARDSLDARAEALELHLATRLRGVRREALAQGRSAGHRYWLPALAAASLAAVFVGVTWFGGQAPHQENGLLQAGLESGASDFDMLTRSEDLELYEQLDFYYWLEQRNTSAG
jgi:hypothetical protein